LINTKTEGSSSLTEGAVSKQRFEPPTLQRFGTLRELTQAKLGTLGDGGMPGASMGP
jgi:hypothetical protein